MEITTDTDARNAERYRSLETGDGDLVIYDREETTAWLQSSHSVSLEQ